jgi:hypothetical protein
VPVSLAGLNASGDIDLAKKAAKLQGQLPGLPGAAGEIIIANDYAYIRQPGDSKYSAAAAANAFANFPNPADPAGVAADVIGFVQIAADSRLKPQLIGTENVVGQETYHIRVNVDPSVANAVLNGAGSALGSGQLDLWIMQSDFHVAVMEFRTSDPKAGAAAFRLVLTNYGESLNIQAPPISQFDVPGISQ